MLDPDPEPGVKLHYNFEKYQKHIFKKFFIHLFQIIFITNLYTVLRLVKIKQISKTILIFFHEMQHFQSHGFNARSGSIIRIRIQILLELLDPDLKITNADPQSRTKFFISLLHGILERPFATL